MAVLPPVGVYARRYVWVEALQFDVLALLVPGLITASAPWARLGLGERASRLAAGRVRHPAIVRAAVAIAPAIAVWIAWRTPAAVNSIHRSVLWLILEAGSLAAVGVAFWLEVFSSPPLRPRSSRPARIALCAAAMWVVWVLAYLVAMSSSPWYRAYLATSHSLGFQTDQQLAAAVLWAGAAGCFIPLCFWNLVLWLRSEENPDEELHRLLIAERRRRAPPRRD